MSKGEAMSQQLITPDRFPQSPQRNQVGITLAIPDNPFPLRDRKPLYAYGICVIRTADLPVARKAFFAGLSVTAVEVTTQQPISTNPFARQITFRDDVEEVGILLKAWFRLDLNQLLRVQQPYACMVHAAFYQYVSNIIYLKLV